MHGSCMVIRDLFHTTSILTELIGRAALSTSCVNCIFLPYHSGVGVVADASQSHLEIIDLIGKEVQEIKVGWSKMAAC